MESERKSRWRTMLWVISASLALHILIVALFYLPAAHKQPEPAPEENVSVELVPPPEEPKPEEKKPEEKKPELPKPPEPKPEEKKPPEQPPEPPKPEKPPEQPKAETPPPPPPPEPKPPEPPKPPEAPKPPPPKAPESPKPPEPAPPEQPKPEADKPNGQDTSAKSMLQPLRPVFKFGDKDTGSKKSDGDSADGDPKPDDAAKPDDAKADPVPDKPTPPDQQPPKADASDKPPTDTKPSVYKPVDDKLPADTPSDKALTVGKPAGAGPLPPDINLPQVDAADSKAEKNGAPGQASDAANATLSPEQAKELADVAAQPPRPETRPTPPTKVEHLTKAKTLFSQSDGGGDTATTAMGDIPRGVRIGQLCATELREQLRHSAYSPEILPAYRLPSGTVMDVPHSQFRSASQWYNLSFRCEVDGDGTKVTSFAFNIGEVVPRSQWRSRGFPQD